MLMCKVWEKIMRSKQNTQKKTLYAIGQMVKFRCERINLYLHSKNEQQQRKKKLSDFVVVVNFLCCCKRHMQ